MFIIFIKLIKTSFNGKCLIYITNVNFKLNKNSNNNNIDTYCLILPFFNMKLSTILFGV